MTRLERYFLARVLERAAAILLVLLWLALFVNLHRQVASSGRLVDPEHLPRLLRRLLESLEMGAAFALSLGAASVLLAWRRDGLLVPFVATGRGLPRLRRALLLLAGGAAVLSAAVLQVTPAHDPAPDPGDLPRILRAEGWIAWCFSLDAGRGAFRDVLLFRDGDTAVLRAARAEERDGTLRLDGVETLDGAAREPRDLRLDAPPRGLLSPARPSEWPRAGLREILAALNRILLPGLALLLSAWVCLAVPANRRRLAYPALLLVLPAVALASLLAGIALWG